MSDKKNKITMEDLATIFEAIEKMNRWRPLYQAVLKITGSKEDARKAVLWVDQYDEESSKGKKVS